MEVNMKTICQILYCNTSDEEGARKCMEIIENTLGRQISLNQRQKIQRKLKNLKIEMQKTRNSLSVSNQKYSKVLDKLNITDETKFKFDYDDDDMSVDGDSDNNSFIIDESNDDQELDLDINQATTSKDNMPKSRGRHRKSDPETMSEKTLHRRVLEQVEILEKICKPKIEKQCLEIALRLALKFAKKDENEEAESILKLLIKLEVKDKLKGSRIKIDDGDKKELPKKLDSVNSTLILLKNNLSVSSYESIRDAVRQCGADILPCYKTLERLKKKTLPDFKVTDVGASIDLQVLTDHTSKRIVDIISNDLCKIIEELQIPLDEKLTAKKIDGHGIDGTTNQREYNQGDSQGKKVDDKALLVASTTPVQLTVERANGEEIFRWRNPSPGSFQWSRTIEMLHQKETPENTLAMYLRIQRQIENLQPFNITLETCHNLEVISEYHMCQIDGKVVKTLANIPSCQTCPVCDANPSDMNKLVNLTNGKFAPKQKAIKPVISPLHAVMNTVLCLFKIGCRLGFQKWRVTKNFEPQYQNARKIINAELWKHFHVTLDEPRSTGGTSTTGSACRKLLQNPQLFADCLGLSRALVVRLAKILKVINCKLDINTEYFGKFALDTYRLFTESYNWFYMPQTLHKILAHGAEIIQASPLSPAFMSEEGPESKNRFFRNYREFHARKISKIANNKDVFGRLLLISDPIFANNISQNSTYRKKHQTIPGDLKEFFIIPMEEDESIQEEENVEAEFENLPPQEIIFPDLENFDEPYESYYFDPNFE
jgi:hypothetical protein